MTRISHLQAAPFAGLFLVLSLLPLVLREQSRGFRVWVVYGVERGDCGEPSRHFPARVLPGGDVVFKHDDGLRIGRSEMEDRLSSIIRGWAEKMFYLEADPDVSFADVLNVIEIVHRDGGNVAILTPSALGSGCPATSFGLVREDRVAVPKPELKQVPLWPW